MLLEELLAPAHAQRAGERMLAHPGLRGRPGGPHVRRTMVELAKEPDVRRLEPGVDSHLEVPRQARAGEQHGRLRRRPRAVRSDADRAGRVQGHRPLPAPGPGPRGAHAPCLGGARPKGSHAVPEARGQHLRLRRVCGALGGHKICQQAHALPRVARHRVGGQIVGEPGEDGVAHGAVHGDHEVVRIEVRTVELGTRCLAQRRAEAEVVADVQHAPGRSLAVHAACNGRSVWVQPPPGVRPLGDLLHGALRDPRALIVVVHKQELQVVPARVDPGLDGAQAGLPPGAEGVRGAQGGAGAGREADGRRDGPRGPRRAAAV
mmetsp:Transcript_5265/g.17764  ORF Transcript_5265/g.17764 Transcript_5265/m.17764 type:complete len:319 (-) Transcript_5265:13-969(-)